MRKILKNICKSAIFFVPLQQIHNSKFKITIMPQMIVLGSEMIRINPAKKTVEYLSIRPVCP